MGIIGKTVDIVFKRPFILIYTGIIVAIFLVLNTYNPVLPLLMGLTSITKSSVFESLVAALQIISDPGFLPVIILGIIGGAIVVSLLGSLLLSGFMFKLDRAVDGLPPKKGEFAFGLKTYFVKILLVNFRTTFLTILFTIFMMVAGVPAIVITKSSVSDRPELLAAAILVDILTVCVVILGMLFYFSYTLFWYPAIYKNVKKAFVTGKRAVDKGFWKIAGRFLVFGFVFSILQYLIFIMPGSALKFAVLWIFWTMFLITLFVYIFTAFKQYSVIKK